MIKAVSYVLAHTPNLVRYGSKPERELRQEPQLAEHLAARLRTFEQACGYPPNQVFIGGLAPEALWERASPWWRHSDRHASRFGRYGEIMPEAEFYGVLRLVDEFDLVWLAPRFLESVRERLGQHPLLSPEDLERLGSGHSIEEINREIAAKQALPLNYQGRVVGCFRRGHDEDPFLSASILLENLACKATGVLAIRWLFKLHQEVEIDPLAIDYIINSGEEAVGDRYQRGAGNLAKAMAELSGCLNSTGGDLKAFCCGPIHSTVMGAGLVQAGIFRNVLVVGGGALAKLGMKFRGHLTHDMPILEDVLASFAILIGPSDGRNPSIRLDAIGKHDVRHSGSAQSLTHALVAAPLDKLGRKLSSIDKYAVELHNPEVTEPAGSGNVPRHNYRTIASLGVIRDELSREAISNFETAHGLPGFSPTQGHVASAIPYLGHARDAMLRGEIQSAMFIGKGSLFLGKMTNLSDGMSFILESSRKIEGRD